jgi:3-isopropylmalate/(R)-2-methylmalate dehydratase small subunit
MKLSGRSWKYGDDINTDYIIPGRYMELTDPDEMALHAMEGIDEEFVTKVQEGDIIVGGVNFGCGSSREHAPLALKYSGVGAVIAESFARIFYRNAINIGLPSLECLGISDIVDKGDVLEIDVSGGEIINKFTGAKRVFTPLPEFILDIINAGGLTLYFRDLEEDW